MTDTLGACILAAHNALQLQAKVDSELVVSELDGAGVVNLEGTVDLTEVVRAVLATQTIMDIDGPRPAPSGHELVRLIVTGSIPTDLPAGGLGDIAANFHDMTAQQVVKALTNYWGAIDWKAAPVEPAA